MVAEVEPEQTALRRLEAELRQAQKMEAVGRLAGGVAHDINNVLTIIQSFGELVLDELQAESAAFQHMGEILAAADRARRLTRQLLAFSRRQMAAPRVCTFNEIASHTERMLRRVIGEDIEMVMRLEPGPWAIEIDPGHFEQVILNLAVNARDAMPDGGSLIVETRNVVLDGHYAKSHGLRLETGRYAMMAVSDTGIGIPPALHQSIFEPFFTTKDKSKGTGLGLSTCYGIVKQARGYIWVYSEAGLGTTFKIYVPSTESAPEPEPAPPPPEPVEPGLRGHETVLVAEDDDLVRQLLVDALTGLGYRVFHAANGVEALALARRHGPELDLLVTDVVMPKMGGRQLSEQLRRELPDLGVLYMSGYTDNAITRQGVLDPEVALLEKPFTPRELARRLRSILDARSTAPPR